MFRKSFKFLAVVLLVCCAAAPARCQDGQWQFVAPMGSWPRSAGAATGPDGRIYAIGGDFTYSLGGVVQAYDPRIDTWTWVAKMSQARQAPGCVTGPDGRIYAIGGSWSVSAEAYDTRANRWSNIAPVPITSGTVHSAAVGNDGRIYALVSASARYLIAYDITRNTWSQVIHPPLTGWTIASDAAGRIYVAGSGFDIFDPQANTWRSAAPMPTARSGFALAPGGDGRVYAIGGDAAGGVEAYGPARDSWAAVSPTNSPRYGCAATMGLDGRVYVLSSHYEFDGTCEVYQISGPRVTAASIHATERVAFTGVVATFKDPRSTNVAGFTSSIQWGDGQTTSGLIFGNGSGGFNVTGTHA